MTEARLYRLTYESSPGHVTEWEKTAAELLVPNGPDDTLLDWMLKEHEQRGGNMFTLEMLPTNALQEGL